MHSVVAPSSTLLAISAGGTASGSYQSDLDYVGGQVAPTTTHTIDTTRVSDPWSTSPSGTARTSRTSCQG